MTPDAGPVRALIGRGEVRHTRLRPVRRAFRYPTWFLLLPMRTLRTQPDPVLARNRAGVVSFHDRDHGDGGADALAWFERLLADEGITDADGEVWLHTYPRVLGFTFKPVSFWYCHGADGALRAIVVEVNNTFGERHCYLLDQPRYGAELRANKVFHVSPFCQVEGGYRFRFMLTPDLQRTVARVDYDDAQGPLIETSVSGTLEPLTAQSVRRALWTYPAMTLGDARAQRKQFKDQLGAGFVPAAKKAAERKAPMPLRLALQTYWDGRQDITDKYRQNAMNALEAYIFPKLGRAWIDELGREDVLEEGFTKIVVGFSEGGGVDPPSVAIFSFKAVVRVCDFFISRFAVYRPSHHKKVRR